MVALRADAMVESWVVLMVAYLAELSVQRSAEQMAELMAVMWVV